MDMQEMFLYGGLLAAVLLWFGWSLHYGLGRGSLAVIFRVIWMVPLFLAFYPESRSVNLPRSVSLKQIYILEDDSASMNRSQSDGRTFAETAAGFLENLRGECAKLGCNVKKTRLSDLNKKVAQGLTPLGESLESWIYQTGGEAWILLSDGGDSHPTNAWDRRLRDVGKGKNGLTRGMILGFKGGPAKNIWVETPEAPVISFENKPIEISVSVRREGDLSTEETVQLQIMTGEVVLSTANAAFRADEEVTTLIVPLPALPKGDHFLTIKALPTGEEVALWDNKVFRSVEVMSDTIGILHLLGSPSWDGRFLRRYLKAEPKYDLISFFILRDPGDMQMVNERELSLIPFPVERLFNEELPNFHTVIIQNFALYQFLEPSYQRNLVKFVNEGGGVLFVGGPRALQSTDIRNSPLASILPFAVEGQVGMGLPARLMVPNQPSKTGPWYDENLPFRIKLADPTVQQRSLANVYEDWKDLGEYLEGFKGLKGLHHMENVRFRQDKYTPLLNAELADGRQIPLAVASYPGKGRALWIFSDSLFRLALNPPANGSREIYSDFLQSSLTWLLRQELKKPLIARGLRMNYTRNKGVDWSLSLIGPAAHFFKPGDQWSVVACGMKVPADQMVFEKAGPENVQLFGSMNVNVQRGRRCRVDIEGHHPSFGSVSTGIEVVIPEVIPDSEMMESAHKLRALGELTGAKTKILADASLAPVQDWLDKVTGTYGVSLPARIKTIRDFYWPLDRWWVWLLLLGLPAEVVTRRWPQLTSSRFRRPGDKRDPTGMMGQKQGS